MRGGEFWEGAVVIREVKNLNNHLNEVVFVD